MGLFKKSAKKLAEEKKREEEERIEKERRQEEYRQERKQDLRDEMIIYEGKNLIVLDDSSVDDDFLWKYVEERLVEGFRFLRNPTETTDYMFLAKLEGPV